MNNDLISRSALKKAFDKWWSCDDIPATVVEDTIDNVPTVDTKELKPLVDKVVEILPELTDAIIKELPKMVSGKIKCSECSYYTNTFNGEWIPVSERLPEENVCDDGYHEPSKWVLVQARNGHMYTTRYWTRDKKNVWTDLEYPDDIIAWRPLPEPYKEGGAE